MAQVGSLSACKAAAAAAGAWRSDFLGTNAAQSAQKRNTASVALNLTPCRTAVASSIASQQPASAAAAKRSVSAKKQKQQRKQNAVAAKAVARSEYKVESDEEVAESSALSLPLGSSWSVHKFGGTCVGTAERIANVANIIASDPSQRKLVVVSAMAKVTNALYALLDTAERGDEWYVEMLAELKQKHVDTAHTLLGEGNPDLDAFLSRLDDDVTNLQAMLKAICIAGNATEGFSDFVVGHGELWSAQILTGTVKRVSGGPCTFLDARDVLVVRPAEGGKQVDPDYDVSLANFRKWYAAKTAANAAASAADGQDGEDGAGAAASAPSMIVATGFIARTPEGVPTTLKRDGSDFSAAIFGSLLRAGKVTIWTDVSGVYSADPRKVNEAVILSSLSYQEAWEMSYFGANVLHPRTTLPVMRHGIPMFIRNAFDPKAPGTRIGESHDALSDNEHVASTSELLGPAWIAERSHDSVVKGFATIDNVALISVEGTGMAGVPGTASQIFTVVKNVGANVIAISQASSEHSVCFVVPESDAQKVAEALEERFEGAIKSGRIHNIGVINECTVLAAVGQRMASTPGVSATLFSALAKAGVNVRAIAQGCSEYNITVVVDKRDSVRALRAVHSRFYLAQTPLAVALIGPGLIGGTLLDQIRDQAATLKKDLNIDLRIVGILGLSQMLVDPRGVDLTSWREALKSKGEPADLAVFVDHMTDSHSLPNTVVVDCTASGDIASHYANWMQRGLHIVTPNKKANSGDLKEYVHIKETQRRHNTQFLYEANVGAGLPIISTLRGLLDTGDKILRIEGIFSGTLSYIFNSFDGSKPFSQIVKEAKANGYTEPDPRDDLAGMDVARKVVILARESGLPLELSEIPVQSLVPQPLQNVSSVEEYLSRLPEFDADMEALRQEAEAAGEVLRFVGVVDAEEGKGQVELRRYPKSHPFSQLTGSDNIISFTTSRYRNQPLIVRGPGAGAEVTAGGVFSDMLRLAACLSTP